MLPNPISYKKYGDQLFLFGSILFAILLPIHKMSTTIPFTILCIAFLFTTKQHAFENRMKKYVLLSIGCYLLLHIISMYFSTYKSYAYNDLLIKAPLFLLPVILSSNASLTPKYHTWVKQSFVFSGFLVSLFIMLRVAYFYLDKNILLSNVELVNYTIIHPSYLAMYLILSLFILWDLKMENYRKKSLILKIFISSSVIICLFFLGSRIAFFALAYFFIFQLLTNFHWTKAFPVFFIIILTIGIVVWQTPFLNSRFTKGIKMLTQSPEEVQNYTVDDRAMIWQNVIELIQEKPIWGYTSGDYCYHVLKEKHNESGFGKGYWQKLNAHNQFLESQLALGVIGTASLLSIYVLSFLVAWERRDRLLLHFLVICCLFSLVESIFQSQGGVMFFGFFLGLFLNKSHHISS